MGGGPITRKGRCQAVDPQIIKELQNYQQTYGKIGGEQLEQYVKENYSTSFWGRTYNTYHYKKDQINSHDDLIRGFQQAYQQKGWHVTYQKIDKHGQCSSPREALYDVEVDNPNNYMTVCFGITYHIPKQCGPTLSYQVRKYYSIRPFKITRTTLQQGLRKDKKKVVFSMPQIDVSKLERAQIHKGYCQICGRNFYNGQIDRDKCYNCGVSSAHFLKYSGRY